MPEEIRCKSCGSPQAKALFKKDDLEFMKCSSCDLVFAGGELGEEELRKLYSYYADSMASQPDRLLLSRYNELLNRFLRYKKTGWLLDVGCGRGDFLAAAKEIGWNAAGVEFSSEASKLGRDKGLDVHCGRIEGARFNDNQFDIVTLFEVLEHLEEPKEALRQAYRVLRPGGILYLTTPNYNSLSRVILGGNWRIFHKEHRLYFTCKTVKNALKDAGFNTHSLTTKNISLGELANLFIKKKTSSLSSRSIDDNLRHKIESCGLLSAGKRIINLFLSIFCLGDTIYIEALKTDKTY